MRTQSRVLVAAVGGIAVLLAFLQPADLRRSSPSAFWDPFILRSTVAVEQYDSLEELVLAADLVLVGRITDLTPGRDFGDKTDTVHYAAATVAIDRLLGGDLPVAAVTLEMQLPHGQGAADVASYAAELPATPALFFLRNKGVEAASAGLSADAIALEAPFYRLVRPDSLIIDEGGQVLPAPGAETSFLTSESGGDFEALVQRIDAVR